MWSIAGSSSPYTEHLKLLLDLSALSHSCCLFLIFQCFFFIRSFVCFPIFIYFVIVVSCCFLLVSFDIALLFAASPWLNKFLKWFLCFHSNEGPNYWYCCKNHVEKNGICVGMLYYMYDEFVYLRVKSEKKMLLNC